MSVRAWIDGCRQYSIHFVKLLNKYEQKQTKIVFVPVPEASRED